MGVGAGREGVANNTHLYLNRNKTSIIIIDK